MILKYLFSRAWLCSLVSLLAVSVVQARPVSYPDGWTVMQKNDAAMSSLHVHYSPTARDSIGYRGIVWDADDRQLHGIQFNRLIKRWNKHAEQANVYVKSALGVGLRESSNRDARIAGLVGIAADWETRRCFSAYENRVVDVGQDVRFFEQELTVGIAPYIGDYGDLHTWLMLKATHSPESDDTVVVTPFLRFFKSYYLAELGVDENGHWLANWIIRF